MRCKVSADESVDGFFYPERGDIVSLSGKNILVLSKNKDNSQNACFIGAVLDSESDGAVHVKGETVEGYVSVRNMSSFTYARRNPVLVDKVESEKMDEVLKLYIKDYFLKKCKIFGVCYRNLIG